MRDFDYQQLANALRQKGIKNEQVLEAIAVTPRHRFMPESLWEYALADSALPIGEDQTISQPYVVARMTEALLEAGSVSKVLEIGTGSGYQAAILSKMVDHVYTIERISSLHEKAKQIFATLQLHNIEARYGDGQLGWPEQAPFDGIIVTAAIDAVPPPLLEQLGENANLVIPVGDVRGQTLQVITRQAGEWVTRHIEPVRFVPLKKGTR